MNCGVAWCSVFVLDFFTLKKIAEIIYKGVVETRCGCDVGGLRTHCGPAVDLTSDCTPGPPYWSVLDIVPKMDLRNVSMCSRDRTAIP